MVREGIHTPLKDYPLSRLSKRLPKQLFRPTHAVIGLAILCLVSLTGAQSPYDSDRQSAGVDERAERALSSLKSVLNNRFPGDESVFIEARQLYNAPHLRKSTPDPLLRAALVSLVGTEGEFVLDAVRQGAIQILIFEKLVDQEAFKPLSQCGPPIDFGGVDLLDRNAVFDLYQFVDGKVDGAIHSGYVNEDIRFLAPIVFDCVFQSLAWNDPSSAQKAYVYEAALARRLFEEWPALEQSQKWIARHYRRRRILQR